MIIEYITFDFCYTYQKMAWQAMITIQNEEEVSNEEIRKIHQTFKANKFILQSCDTLDCQNLEKKSNN